MKICYILLSLILFQGFRALGQGPFQAMNPNIGVIGDFSYRNHISETGPDDGFRFNEAEISFRMVLDPFARADFYVAVVPEEEAVELEEGFLTLLSLPFSSQARVGHFRNAFGKFNLTHPPETALAVTPLFLNNYFGEEGLSETGISVSTIISNPWGVYLETSLDALNGDNPVSFGNDSGRLSYLAHLKSFVDLTENSNVEVGVSAMTGAFGSHESHTTRLFGGDAIYRWKPLGRGTYRSFTFQSEGLVNLRDGESGTIRSFGLFVFSQVQLSKRWFLGLTYDRSGLPNSENDVERRISALVTFWPSEFQTVKVQLGHTRRNFTTLRTVNAIHFQWTFVIGAHGAHKF